MSFGFGVEVGSWKVRAVDDFLVVVVVVVVEKKKWFSHPTVGG